MHNNVCTHPFFTSIFAHNDIIVSTQQEIILIFFNYFNSYLQVKTEERMLLQFHYTEWHSHTTPFTNAVLEFRRRVRSVVGNTLKSDRPMLVHCNDGGEWGDVTMVKWRHFNRKGGDFSLISRHDSLDMRSLATFPSTLLTLLSLFSGKFPA